MQYTDTQDVKESKHARRREKNRDRGKEGHEMRISRPGVNGSRKSQNKTIFNRTERLCTRAVFNRTHDACTAVNKQLVEGVA
jgi:hypothetical protein